MRLFFAIPLPEGVKNTLEDLKSQLARNVQGVKWVERGNLHITLKFLGEVEEDRVQDLVELADMAWRDQRSFFLELGALGAFPNLQKPRVIWVGVRGEHQRALEIAKNLDRNLSHLGFETEKDIKLHITLGRVKHPENAKQLFNNIINIKYEAGCGFDVDRLQLLESRLSRVGPEYRVLHEFLLNKE